MRAAVVVQRIRDRRGPARRGSSIRGGRRLDHRALRDQRAPHGADSRSPRAAADALRRNRDGRRGGARVGRGRDVGRGQRAQSGHARDGRSAYGACPRRATRSGNAGAPVRDCNAGRRAASGVVSCRRRLDRRDSDASGSARNAAARLGSRRWRPLIQRALERNSPAFGPGAKISRVTLDGLVEAYLNHLRVERALSPRTLEAYGRDLGKLLAFAEQAGITEPTAIDLGAVSGWLGSLAKDGLGARSAARHLSAARGLMKFLLREGALASDPTELSARPRFGRRLPRTLSEAEVLRLLEAPDTTTLRGLRDRAMLSVAYAAGLRVSELVNLTPGDV